ncbi:MAG: MiaB/RimO family radical SAM methylthiotransferase, partial [Planctomycetota bacterium]
SKCVAQSVPRASRPPSSSRPAGLPRAGGTPAVHLLTCTHTIPISKQPEIGSCPRSCRGRFVAVPSVLMSERGTQAKKENMGDSGDTIPISKQPEIGSCPRNPPPSLAGAKVHVLTFGCQMNKYDSGMVAGLLHSCGAALVQDVDEADLVVINTCSVRAHAEERVYNHLHLLRRRKQGEPGFLLAVIGCMAQKEGARLAARCPWVDVIAGTRMLDEIPALLQRVREGARTPLLAIDRKPSMDFGETQARRESRFLAYLAVSRGCNKRCTYCVVPYTRGAEVSRPLDQIVAEARRLAADGVVEITLLGQTIDSYGHDLKDGTTLWKLLRALHPIAGLQRIRFVTSHPKECRPELFATMAELRDKVMPFIHMPPQSGSDRHHRGLLRRDRGGFCAVAGAVKGSPLSAQFCLQVFGARGHTRTEAAGRRARGGQEGTPRPVGSGAGGDIAGAEPRPHGPD